MKKTAEFRLSTFLIGFFAVFIVMATFGGIYIDLAQPSKYNVTISQTFKGAYTNDTELYGFVEETAGMGVNITDSALTAKQLEDDYSDPSKALIRATQMIYKAFPLMQSMIINTASLLHVPPIYVIAAIGVVLILFIFAFISLIFRWKS